MFYTSTPAMSRTQESGAYPGGIGTMLEVPDVCLSCGEVHSEKHFGIRHGERRECPKVIMGRFPLLSRPDGEGVPEVPVRSSASQRIREFETPTVPPPVSLGSLPRRRNEPESRTHSMGMPWLPLPDLGEVI
jgi:hypothetical protein